MAYGPHVVLPLPRQYQRRHLMPLQGSPWLVVRPPSPTTLTLVFGSWLLLLLASRHSALGLLGLLGGLVCFALVYGTYRLALRHIQVCPECLRDMARTATTCPHCRFHPTQEVR